MNIGNLISNPQTLIQRIWRKLRLLKNPTERAIFKLVDDSLFECSLRDSVGRMLTQGIMVEEEEQQFVRATLSPGDIFIDIGANLGLLTLIAAKAVGPTGHIYAFEPSERERGYLQRNLALNHLNNVTILPYAVGAMPGMARLAISQDGGSNSLKQNSNPEQQIQRWQEVEIITLDHFVVQQKLGKVALIKIDVEGGEINVLQGASQLLSSENPPMIMTEFCDATAAGFGSSGAMLFDHFIQLGYQLYEMPSTNNRPLQLAVRQEKYYYANLIGLKK